MDSIRRRYSIRGQPTRIFPVSAAPIPGAAQTQEPIPMKTLFLALAAALSLGAAQAAGIRVENGGEDFRIFRTDDGNVVGGGRVTAGGGMENFEIHRQGDGPTQPRRIPVPMGSGETFWIEYR